MPAETIGGLFKSQTRGQQALQELKQAGFSSAQISEAVDDSDAAPEPKKLGNPLTDFFQDHTTTGSEFLNNLTALGMSSADAEYFEDGVARGGALVTVKADSRAAEALEILQRNGADLGGNRREATGTSATGSIGERGKIEGEQTIELREERLAIEKVRVASGEVRIGKRVVSQEQQIDVPVVREELVIERHPVTGEAVGGTIGDDKSITVPLSREEVNVRKDTVVTEEVEVGKREAVQTERVAETVRHEELVVNESDASTSQRR